MATVTTFVDGTVAVENALDNVAVWAHNRIDCSVTGITSGDTVQMLKVLDGQMVLDWVVSVATAEGAAATGSFGDASDIDGYDAAANLNSATIQSTTRGTDAYAVGRLYAADDTIDLLPAQTLDTAIFHVYALVKNCRNDLA